MHLIQIMPLGSWGTREPPLQMVGLPSSDLFFCGLHEEWRVSPTWGGGLCLSIAYDMCQNLLLRSCTPPITGTETEISHIKVLPLRPPRD